MQAGYLNDEKALESLNINESSDTENEGSTSSKTPCTYVPFAGSSPYDYVFDSEGREGRVDVLKFSEKFSKNLLQFATFRFKIVLLEKDSSNNSYKVISTCSQMDFAPMRTVEGSLFHNDLGNSVLGQKLYHNGRIFSYAEASFKNNVMVSEPGEFVTPLSNVIDVSASEDSVVTTVLPWKDYLFIATPQAVYLTSQVTDGFLTKTVNTAIGIPLQDSKCAVPTLNGVVFKSGAKVYMLYPNMYAGDDSVLNVTDISNPVESVLETYFEKCVSEPFAFGTDSEYVLMLPISNSTLCLKYTYTTHIWSVHTFPVTLTSATVFGVNDVVCFGTTSNGSFCEYHFDKDLVAAYGKDFDIPYGDIVTASENGIVPDLENFDNSAYDTPAQITPISFEIDTGQKTEALFTQKQFVETKFVLTTSAIGPAIDMNVTVTTDGERSVVTRDISTDGAFWKTVDNVGMLNAPFSQVADTHAPRDVIRQLVLRYSGKGMSVRHIITGTSVSNFKLYETYVRYRLLNVKQ